MQRSHDVFSYLEHPLYMIAATGVFIDQGVIMYFLICSIHYVIVATNVTIDQGVMTGFLF